MDTNSSQISDVEKKFNVNEVDEAEESKLMDSEKDITNLMQQQENLSKRYSLLVDNSYKSDVKFVFADGKVINAHELILSIGSPVFSAMFNDSWKNNEPILITDFTSENFKELLYYIYTNQVNNLNDDNAIEIFEASHKYQVMRLENIISDFLIEKVTIDNACSYYEKSLSVLFLNKLTAFLEEFIQKNTQSILDTESFLSIQSESLKGILSMPSLNIDEHDLFMHIIKWSNDVCVKKGINCTAYNIRSSLNGAEKLIRFPTMTMDNFIKCTEKLPLFLSKDEVCEIMFSITSSHLYYISSLQFSQIKRGQLYANWDYNWDLNCGTYNSNKEKLHFTVNSKFKIKSINFDVSNAEREITIKNIRTNATMFTRSKISTYPHTLLLDNDTIYANDTWYEMYIYYSYRSANHELSSVETKNINKKGEIKLQWASTKNISIKTLSLSMIP